MDFASFPILGYSLTSDKVSQSQIVGARDV